MNNNTSGGPTQTPNTELRELVKHLDEENYFSEQVYLNLASPPASPPPPAPASVRHYFAHPNNAHYRITQTPPQHPTTPPRILGYAQVEAHSMELYVAPAHRRQGIGTALLHAALQNLPPGTKLNTWARTTGNPAKAFATRHNGKTVRNLIQMEREVKPTDTTLTFQAPGYHLENFNWEKHSRAWVETNKEIFSWHPEQGGLTLADLRQRTGEEWFDPGLFWLLYEGQPGRSDQGAQPAGYLWLKSLTDSGDMEIYAVGLLKSHAGKGLGGQLVRQCLGSAAREGKITTSLYVEGDNAPAVNLYKKTGYRVSKTNLQYSIGKG